MWIIAVMVPTQPHRSPRVATSCTGPRSAMRCLLPSPCRLMRSHRRQCADHVVGTSARLDLRRLGPTRSDPRQVTSGTHCRTSPSTGQGSRVGEQRDVRRPRCTPIGRLESPPARPGGLHRPVKRPVVYRLGDFDLYVTEPGGSVLEDRPTELRHSVCCCQAGSSTIR